VLNVSGENTSQTVLTLIVDVNMYRFRLRGIKYKIGRWDVVSRENLSSLILQNSNPGPEDQAKVSLHAAGSNHACSGCENASVVAATVAPGVCRIAILTSCAHTACHMVRPMHAALGINALHELSIIHRDIKAENILIDVRENV
jgi:serine/threonine protein kinase